MKVLITGATGFIGNRLARDCISADFEVIALGLTQTSMEQRTAEELSALGVDVRLCSVLDKAAVRSACEGVDAVVHLAAAQHETKVGFEYFRAVNVDGTRNLLEACRETGAGRFVYASTIGVYGSADGTPLTENSPLNPRNHYTRSKVMAEQVVQEFAGNLNTTIVRISETYGPGDLRLLKLFKGVANGWFPVIGPCENKHQPILVDELSGCLLEIVSRDDLAGEIFILAGPNPVSTGEMIISVENALHKHNNGPHIPMLPMLGTAVVLEKLLPVIGLSPPLTRRRLDFFRTNFWFDVTKVASTLRQPPAIEFDTGAELTSDWYRTQGMLPDNRLH